MTSSSIEFRELVLYRWRGIGSPFCAPLLLVLILVSMEIVSCQQSSYGCYPQFSSQHSGCLGTSRCEGQVASGVSDGEKQQIVALHNEVRAIAARAGLSRSLPGAADMLSMQWDNELAYIAQKWADQCIKSTDCANCRQVSRFPVGQSVFFYELAPDNSGRGANWSKPFDSWAILKVSLDTAVIQNYRHNSDWAAYTQLIWSQSYLVGCGFTKQLRRSRGYYTYVCNYGPAGNVQGSPVYSIGRPCTQCPAGFDLCSYEGLCRQGANEQPTTRSITPTTQSYYYSPPPMTTSTLAVQTTVLQRCPRQCIPGQYVHLCDPKAIAFATFVDCSPANGEVCCSLAPTPSPTTSRQSPPAPTAVATATTTTITTTPPPRRCLYDCVRYDLRGFCERGTVDFGRTTCAAGEICCQTRPVTSSPITLTTTTTTTMTTPRHPVITTPRGPPCRGEFSCVPKSSIQQKCDLQRLAEFLVTNPGATLGSCSPSETCCPRRRKVGCPSTHVCLPKNSAALCLPSSVISSADIDCNSNEKVCCQLDPLLLDRPSTTIRNDTDKTCKDACLSGIDADLCVATDSLVPGATCSSGRACCRLGDLDESVVQLNTGIGSPPPSIAPVGIEDMEDEALALRVPPLPCDGFGQCMATYLTSVCENKGGVPQKFSSLFVCTNPRLRCCVQHAIIERRVLALRGSGDSETPKSPLTGSACGKRAPKVQFTSEDNKFCWMVDIVDANNQVRCHGALVELQFISTTASCALDVVDIRTMFAKFPWRQEKYAVVTHLAHYEFNAQTLDSNLNVLRLSEQINLDITGGCLLCIPEKKSKKDLIMYTYSSMAQDRTFGSTIHKAPAKVGKQDICERAGFFDETGQGPKNSACMQSGAQWCGEKGAPLVFERDGLSWLAGHLSFPSGDCFKAGSVGMYTDTLGKWAVDFFKNTLRALGSGILVPAQSDDAIVNSKQGGNTADSRKSCASLNAVPNGSFRIVSCEDVQAINLIPLSVGRNMTECLVGGSRYAVGSRVNYHCDDFYSLYGDAWRSCEADGNWNGVAPICQPACGRRFLQVGLASGGQKSMAGEWPWTVALYSKSVKLIICAGALIKEDWVLTAAHCVVNFRTQRVAPASEFVVYLGKTYRSIAKDDELVQQRTVTNIIAHPSYSTDTYDSDIALMRLSSPATLNERVQLICIPRRYDISESNMRSGKSGIVAGWGLNEFGKFSEDLTHVELPVVSVSKCREDTTKSFGDSAATRLLNANMYCAGHGAETSPEDYQSVCEGDSGGPMAFQEKSGSEDAWHVEGIVSFYIGSAGCDDRKPGMYAIFTRVHNFYQWIDYNAV